jgi:hypothetical protein
MGRRGAAALILLVLAGTAVAGLVARRLWPLLEPARTLPLLPGWSWQHPLASPPATQPAPVEGLSPGWRASALGNPAARRYPHCWQSLPRTPWALKLFDGRLYVGLGHAGNEGPTANAGPVPLLAYDLAAGRWRQEATLAEEEIHRFVNHGRQLWIPGSDPRGGWRLGNLYRRQAGRPLWWQQRRLPGFIHANDLAWRQGRLVVAGSVDDAVASAPEGERHGSALAVSSDGGRHWQVERLAGWRATALVPLDGQLYGLEALPGPRLRRWLAAGGRLGAFVLVYELQADGRWRPRRDLQPADLLPGVVDGGRRHAWIGQVTAAGEGVAWIASLGPGLGEPPRRQAFMARSLRPGAIDLRPVLLPAGEQAMDLQADGQGWLLLSSVELAPQRWRSRISRLTTTPGGSRSQELVRWQAPLPAWSLAAERAGDAGRWFVGLGHPPFRREPLADRCHAADAVSGTVVALRPPSPPTSR